MKRTGNQKVVTAAIQKHSSKALFAPYPACTGIPDRNTIYAVTIQNRGLAACRCGYSEKRKSRPCQFSDFKSGYCRRGLSHNFRVGSNQIPLCSSQKRKAAYIPPENRGYVCTGSNLLPENSGYVATGGYALQGYISNRTFKGRNSLFSGSALFM